MTYQQALQLRVCPNCSAPIIRIEQEVIDDNTQRIKFIHKAYENFCEDIIEDSYHRDSRNIGYFQFLIDMTKALYGQNT